MWRWPILTQPIKRGSGSAKCFTVDRLSAFTIPICASVLFEIG